MARIKTMASIDAKISCFLSSKIPGYYRIEFPEKTAGNSRVLPSTHITFFRAQSSVITS